MSSGFRGISKRPMRRRWGFEVRVGKCAIVTARGRGVVFVQHSFRPNGVCRRCRLPRKNAGIPKCVATAHATAHGAGRSIAHEQWRDGLLSCAVCGRPLSEPGRDCRLNHAAQEELVFRARAEGGEPVPCRSCGALQDGNRSCSNCGDKSPWGGE